MISEFEQMVRALEDYGCFIRWEGSELIMVWDDDPSEIVIEASDVSAIYEAQVKD